MPQGKGGEFIGLDQGEGGAGNLHGFAGQGGDYMARQGGLAGAQVPAETDHIARLEQVRQAAAKTSRRIEVGEDDVGACDGEHEQPCSVPPWGSATV